MESIMYSIAGLIGVILFLSIEKNEPQLLTNGNTRNQQISVRGVFALLIILCHMFNNTGIYDSPYASKIINLVFPSIVAIFFFYSGYGLTFQFRIDTAYDFQKKIVKNTIKLFLPATIAFLIAELTAAEKFQYSSIWDVLSNIGGWFPKTLLYLYFLFFLVAYFAKSKSSWMKVLYICGGVAIFIVISKILGLPSTYYVDCPAFIFGILWGMYPQKVLIILKHFSLFIIGLIATICSGTTPILMSRSILPSGAGIGLIMGMVGGVALCLTIQMLLTKIRFKNHNLLWLLGVRSYEIYLCGPIAKNISMELCSSKESYYVCYTALCIVAGSILHEIIKERKK